MEFLMRKFLPIVICAGALMLAGCAASDLSRKNQLLSPPSKYITTGIETTPPSGETFDGHLDLLYEKKIKGSAGRHFPVDS